MRRQQSEPRSPPIVRVHCQQGLAGDRPRVDLRPGLRGDRDLGVTGPLFHFSDTWQLVINTGTTIVTFLMVFLMQNSQNQDSAAIQVKLDELIRTGAVQNSFVGIEHLSADELEELRALCEERAKAVAALRGKNASWSSWGAIRAPMNARKSRGCSHRSRSR